MLNPGLAHNPFVAKIAGVDVMDVIGFHYKANLASLVVATICITIIAHVLKEDKGHVPEHLQVDKNFKVNYLYALMPVVPIIILLLGSTKIVPLFKMGVPQAMIIGALLTLVVTRTKPKALCDAFFEGMGKVFHGARTSATCWSSLTRSRSITTTAITTITRIPAAQNR